MGAAALIERAGEAGVRLSVADGKLIATPLAALSDELRAELRANKPELVAVLSPPPSATPALTCAGCLHRLKPGTCGEPVAAGLLTLAEGFGIAWPPKGHGAACPAFTGKTPTAAANQPYRLTNEDADRCHAPCWDDAEIAVFTARAERFALLGLADADDLAERLTLRDREDDERVSCTDCRHYRPGRCGNHRRAGLQSPDVGRDWVALLHRCPGFKA